jgi:hypothetical protein
MEFVIIHKPVSLMPPEMMAAGLEMAKQIEADPEKMVPGGKAIASYYARALWCIFCIWEAPSLEALLPLAEQLKMLGWNTDIIPVDKPKVAIQKIEMAMQASMKK